MARVEGVAIHSGRRVGVTLHRAAGPIRFLRDGVEIEACVANIAGADRATTLASAGAKVALVEHLLAALRVAGFFTEVAIEVDGDELPILDGSAQPWLEAIAELGEPAASPSPLVVRREVEVALGESRAIVSPGPESLDCAIDFAHPGIGRQRWSGGPETYGRLLDARTFGFLSDVADLRKRALALGAGIEHAIVFADEGPVRPLRSADEPVRHKALDAIGDLGLLGRPVAGAISIERGSHALHHLLMRRLLEHARDPDARGTA